ncbi:MAG: CapA family protein [Marinilabiliaceae bacterium]|nr:CapA family protein [Marinilabiliaceae bacterium]
MRKIVFFAITLLISVNQQVIHSQSINDSSTLSLLFLGDIMGHDSQIAAAYNPNNKTYNYSSSFQYVAPIISSADITFANLEVTLDCKPFKGYPSFSSPKELAINMKECGIDVTVTANNHSCDRGRKGIDRTIAILDSLDFYRTGTFIDSADKNNNHPLLIEKKGFRIALLNYTYGTNGIPVPKGRIVNLIEKKQIEIDILKAKNLNPDIVIAFMHWGLEYQTSPNKSQIELADILHKKGVQLVIGSHPHVLQPMEYDTIQNQATIYSLGNFISAQRTAPRDGAAMVKIELTKDTTKTLISKVNYILTYVHYPIINKKRDFIVVPVADVENGLISNNNGWGRLWDFSKEARAILSRNISVTELIPVTKH